MFNGSRYVVSRVGQAGARPGRRAAARQPAAQPRHDHTTFHTVVGNTNVTANAWVRLQATYDVALANSSLTLYVESTSGTPSFYIDDFKHHVRAAGRRRARHPVGLPDAGRPTSRSAPPCVPADIHGRAGVPAGEALQQHDLGQRHEVGRDRADRGHLHLHARPTPQVAFAKANNMRVRGHTLVWHNQTPGLGLQRRQRQPDDADAGEPGAADPAHAEPHPRRDDRTSATTSPTWDVVNEPIDPSQPDGFRRSPWFNIIGPEYIEIALRAARAASPTAKLYINDFDTTNPPKRDVPAGLVATSRAAASRSTASATRCTTTSSTRRSQTIIDADQHVRHDRAWSNRSPSWTSASTAARSNDAVPQLHRHPGQPPQRWSATATSTSSRPSSSCRGRSCRSRSGGPPTTRPWLTSSAQGRRAAAVRPVAEEEARLLGVGRSAAAPGRRPVDDADRRADDGRRPGRRSVYTITVTNNADHDTSVLPADATTTCRRPTS